MLLYKPKKNQTAANKGGNRLLISITVLGSAGPIRFVVSEDELVAAVIDTALKSYAREGRLPVLGSNLNDFFLYCPNAGPEGNPLFSSKPISDIHCFSIYYCCLFPKIKISITHFSFDSNFIDKNSFFLSKLDECYIFMPLLQVSTF